MDALTSYVLCKDLSRHEMQHSEVKRVQYNVEHILEDLFSLVEKVDPRFTLHAIHGVGSYYDGTKISPPNEFDYLIELSDFHDPSKFRIHNSTFGYHGRLTSSLKKETGIYKRIELIDEELITKWKDDACSNIGTTTRPRYLLDQVELKKSLWYALDKVWNLVKTKLPRGFEAPEPPNLGNGPSLGINLIWKGRKFPVVIISVDLTIAIHIPEWPEAYDFHKLFPPGNALRDIFFHLVDLHGHHLVPYVDGEGKLLDCVWKVSSSLIECLFLSTFQEDSKPKRLLRMFKIIKKRYFETEIRDHCYGDKPHEKFITYEDLSSYIIKQSVFYIMARIPRKLWLEEDLGHRFVWLLSFLVGVYKKQYLYDFFCSAHKLHLPDEGNTCLDRFAEMLDDLEAEFADVGYPNEVFGKVLTYMPVVNKARSDWKYRYEKAIATLPEQTDVFGLLRSRYCPLPKGQCYKEHNHDCIAKALEIELGVMGITSLSKMT